MGDGGATRRPAAGCSSAALRMADADAMDVAGPAAEPTVRARLTAPWPTPLHTLRRAWSRAALRTLCLPGARRAAPVDEYVAAAAARSQRDRCFGTGARTTTTTEHHLSTHCGASQPQSFARRPLSPLSLRPSVPIAVRLS